MLYLQRIVSVHCVWDWHLTHPQVRYTSACSGSGNLPHKTYRSELSRRENKKAAQCSLGSVNGPVHCIADISCVCILFCVTFTMSTALAKVYTNERKWTTIQSIWITKNQPHVTTSCLQVWCANIYWPWCLEIKDSSYCVRRLAITMMRDNGPNNAIFRQPP